MKPIPPYFLIKSILEKIGLKITGTPINAALEVSPTSHYDFQTKIPEKILQSLKKQLGQFYDQNLIEISNEIILNLKEHLMISEPVFENNFIKFNLTENAKLEFFNQLFFNSNSNFPKNKSKVKIILQKKFSFLDSLIYQFIENALRIINFDSQFEKITIDENNVSLKSIIIELISNKNETKETNSNILIFPTNLELPLMVLINQLKSNGIQINNLTLIPIGPCYSVFDKHVYEITPSQKFFFLTKIFQTAKLEHSKIIDNDFLLNNNLENLFSLKKNTEKIELFNKFDFEQNQLSFSFSLKLLNSLALFLETGSNFYLSAYFNYACKLLQQEKLSEQLIKKSETEIKNFLLKKTVTNLFDF